MNIGYYWPGSNQDLACREGTYNNITRASNISSWKNWPSNQYSFNGSSTCYNWSAKNYIKNAKSEWNTTWSYGFVLNAAKTCKFLTSE